ncbi:hypothetical protein AAG906_013025 [Vitis piasezkii]
MSRGGFSSQGRHEEGLLLARHDAVSLDDDGNSTVKLRTLFQCHIHSDQILKEDPLRVGILLMEDMKGMAISPSLSAKAEMDSFLYGIKLHKVVKENETLVSASYGFNIFKAPSRLLWC